MTELGKQFVHYVIEDVVSNPAGRRDRLGWAGSQAVPIFVHFRRAGWRIFSHLSLLQVGPLATDAVQRRLNRTFNRRPELFTSKFFVLVFVIGLCSCRKTQAPSTTGQISPEVQAAENAIAGARIFGKPGAYIAPTRKQYEACREYLKSGVVQRCELAGDVDSALIRTKPGLKKQFPQFSDLLVGDYAAKVPIGPIGSLTIQPRLVPLGVPGGCSVNMQPRQATGPVITNAHIQNLYWGKHWTTDRGSYEMLIQDHTWADLANSPQFYSLLAQYSLTGQAIVAGSWAGHNPGIDLTVNNTSLANNSFLTEAQIQAELIKEIPFTPTAIANDTIYIIYFPPGATAPLLSSAYAYHLLTTGDAHDPANPGSTRPYFYAVIGYPTLIDGGTMDFDSANISEAHEIDETITDPTTNQGWRDANDPSPNSELGDKCNRQASDFATYTVQQVWDQANCKCADRVPQPSTPIAPQNCKLYVGCADSVTVDCDMVDEWIALQRNIKGKWTTVTVDKELPRFHIPFLFDQAFGEQYAAYRACGTNSHNDLVCAPSITTGLPHASCSTGGGSGGGGGGVGGQTCGGRNQPRCSKA